MATVLYFTIMYVMAAATHSGSDMKLWPNSGLTFEPAKVLIVTGEREISIKIYEDLATPTKPLNNNDNCADTHMRDYVFPSLLNNEIKRKLDHFGIGSSLNVSLTESQLLDPNCPKFAQCFLLVSSADHRQTVFEHYYEKIELSIPIKFVKLSSKINQGISKVMIELINAPEHVKITISFPLLQISHVETREGDSKLTIIIKFKKIKLTNLRSHIDVYTDNCNSCILEIGASLFRSPRSKRSFLGFVRNTDLTEAMSQAITKEALQDSLMNNQIQEITNRINKAGLVLEHDSDLVENLSLELCSTYSELKNWEITTKINNVANSVVTTILDITRQCSELGIPSEINMQILNGICLTAFPSETCDHLNSNFRLFVKCSVAGVYQLQDKYVIDLSLTIPIGLMSPYSASEIFTIPVIKNATATEISIKPGSFYIEILSQNSHTVVRDCDTINEFSLCSINNFDMTVNNCIDALKSHYKSENCISTSIKLTNEKSCFVKRLSNGFLISSNYPIKTYSSSSLVGFTKSSSEYTGIYFLADQKDEILRFTCNSLE